MASKMATLETTKHFFSLFVYYRCKIDTKIPHGSSKQMLLYTLRTERL